MACTINAHSATIIFADSSDTVYPETLRGTQTPIRCGKTLLPYVIIQHQVHGAAGHAITHDNEHDFRTLQTYDSDYLIANLTTVGLGVLTADCLPIALLDPVKKVIGMAHAGWRGSVANIAGNAVAHMTTQYGCNPADIRAWFGPCAHPCCYTVNQQFIDQLPTWARAAVHNQHFDLCACNTCALQACGVPPSHIDCSASVCTICNQQFLSYRRNPSLTARQPSIIWLN